jgi:alpha-D-ribose 1-methylphosphonate 5-triphosphate synthase subunit PhnH
MNTNPIQGMVAGFAHEALGSQMTFRAALHALAHPGQICPVRAEAEWPCAGHAASAGLLLALLDVDCKLWLSPTLAQSATAHWLRFHTGCVVVEEIEDATFVWVDRHDGLPALSALAQGSDADPETSATLVMDVHAIGDSPEKRHGTPPAEQTVLTLVGPGIATESSLSVSGLAPSFVGMWSANHSAFPRGVDAYFCTSDALVGLPRTTRVAPALQTVEV